MAQLGITFTADPNAPKAGRDVIPAGVYDAQIVASEIKATRDGNGQIIALTWEIMGGPFDKRVFWQNLNYVNPNEKAQKIARAELNDIQVAIGLGALTDTSQLHMKPCSVKLKIIPAKGEYPEKNEIAQVNKWVPGGAQAAPPAATTPGSAFAQTPQTQDTSQGAAPAGDKPWG